MAAYRWPMPMANHILPLIRVAYVVIKKKKIKKIEPCKSVQITIITITRASVRINEK